MDDLFVDDATDLVEEMPANVVKRILAQADPATRRMINELLKYPEDSARRRDDHRADGAASRLDRGAGDGCHPPQRL